MSEKVIWTWKYETERPKQCDFETISQLNDYLLSSKPVKNEEIFIRIYNGKIDVRLYLGYDGEDWNFLEASTPLGERYYDYLVYLFNKNKSHE